MTTTNTDNAALRTPLLTALVARAVGDPEQLVDSLDRLDGCMNTIRFWDDYQGKKSPALLAHMLKTGQHRDYEPGKRDAPSFWQTGFHDLVDEMRAEGFDERQAPLAASAVMVRPNVSRAGLRAHLAAQYPEAFGS